MLIWQYCCCSLTQFVCSCTPILFSTSGTVSPPDILTNPEYSNFVFVSTIRHPISRIISSLHNDPIYKKAKCRNTKQTMQSWQLNACAHKLLESDASIKAKCADGAIYYCYSNYFVRMFAGHQKQDGLDVTRKTLDAAKRNFLRYSCVVVQERWDETAVCLSRRLGLHLSSSLGFNIQGKIGTATSEVKMTTATAATAKDQSSSALDFSKTLNPEEVKRLEQLNALDIEFYEWAKQIVLSPEYLQ